MIGRRIQIVATTGLDAQPIRTIFCSFFYNILVVSISLCFFESFFVTFAVGEDLWWGVGGFLFFLSIHYLSTPLSISESRRREVFVVVVGGRCRRRRQQRS